MIVATTLYHLVCDRCGRRGLVDGGDQFHVRAMQQLAHDWEHRSFRLADGRTVHGDLCSRCAIAAWRSDSDEDEVLATE